MNKAQQIELTREIVETAYKLLTHKIAYGGLELRKTAACQLEFGHIVKTLGHLYEFKLADKFLLACDAYIELDSSTVFGKSKRARVDFLLTHKDDAITTKAVIELKFYEREDRRESYDRYNFFQELFFLELYKKQGFDLCYLILGTDHPHYYNEENYPEASADFDFRTGKSYKAGTILQYKTEEPYGPAIALSRDYSFDWDRLNDLYFLKLQV